MYRILKTIAKKFDSLNKFTLQTPQAAKHQPSAGCAPKTFMKSTLIEPI